MAVHVTRAGVALTVGIILLTGLIIGGLLWAKESGEQARRAEALQVAEQNLEEQSRRDVALNESEAAKEDRASAPAIPGTGHDGASVDALPETGAGDQLLSAAVLSIFVFLAATYIQARTKTASFH